MQISKKQTSDLNAIITIEVKPEDYQPRVNKTIKSYTKSASIPGFRPGHVPEGIIRKRIGKEILVEELNKLLGEELINYLRDNKIDVIGSPLPVQNTDQMAIEEGKNFSFDYEIGIAPQIDLKMPSRAIPYYMIKVDDKMVEDDVNDLRRRYGKFSNPEAAEETSVLYGDFYELDEKGEPKPDGVSTTTTLSIELVRDADEKKKFIGVKKDEQVWFSPLKAMQNETEVSAMLRVGKDSPALHSDYKFKVKTVNRIEKADLNQEFFEKVYGEGVVNNEEEFRTKIRDGIASYFDKESRKKFQKDARLVFLEENQLQLPDEFLKRMLKSRHDKKIDDHEFEHEYFHVAEDLRWNLLQNKIAADQSFTVNEKEIVDTAQIMIVQQFAQYGVAPPEREKLDELVNDYLNKEDNYERLERTLLGQRVFDYLKTTIKLDTVELPYDDFIEKLKEKTAHEVEHHHH